MKKLKPMKVVMLEHIAESGNYEWYSITRGETPEQAIRNYMAENHCMILQGSIDDKGIDETYRILKDNEGHLYDTEENCRAYYITI